MTAPRTAAGRALLTEARSWDDPIRIRWETTVIDGYAAIRAIEDEARAALLADIRARVEGLRAYEDHSGPPLDIDIYDPSGVRRAEVLAILDSLDAS